ncbi:hypothetical protein CMV_001597 [Castanea mollissima]|uniref:Reverse transcriptase n=1 Tax=Castanea mollissima TaxID=60419 RepID=A0A8J4W4A1_9ROSI|nr:hypothetical protein CMV_001597 [Castanea mollissima]
MVISKPLDASKFAYNEKVPMKRTMRRRIRTEQFDKGIRLVSQASLASNEEEVVVVDWMMGQGCGLGVDMRGSISFAPNMDSLVILWVYAPIAWKILRLCCLGKDLEFKTFIKYNLDRPEARQDQGWAKGCILESPDSFIESLVQRVNCWRFRTKTTSITSSLPSSPQNTYRSCSEAWDSTIEIDTIRISSRKRIRKEIGRFGRNIKQRLCFALFDEKVLQVQASAALEISIDNCTPVFQGFRKLLKARGSSVGTEGLSGGLVLDWHQNVKLSIQYGSKHLIRVDLIDHKGADSFLNTINDLELCELKAKGQRFTWMNRREDEAFVMEKLDKAFASVEWVNTYPHYALYNHPILRLDHGPILLDFEMQPPYRRRPFRFERMWLTHNACKDMIQKAWEVQTQGSRAFKLQHKPDSVRKRAIEWNRTVFGKIEKELKEKQPFGKCKINIQTITDVRMERVLREEIEVLMNREGIMLAQRARNEWILKGDRNTKKFQTLVKQRRAR